MFVDSARGTFENGSQLENVETARSYLKEDIRYGTLDLDLKDLMKELTAFILLTCFLILEETNDTRKVAASNVEPVIVNAGEVIVTEEQIITNEFYEDLRLTGLLDG